MSPSTIQKKTVCPLDCPDSCGLIATVQAGQVLSLQGDREHPYTKGFICRKMRGYPRRLHGEERVRYPQRRIGNKGEGRFARISWEEALDEAANRLEAVVARHGGEAILPFWYAGNMGVVNRNAGCPLFHRLGTTLIEETFCSAAASAGWQMQCGPIPGSPPEKAADADLIVAWGCNVKVTNIHFWQYITHARLRGGRLLVVDPYRNTTARSADRFVQVRPGGDAALALGSIKALIEARFLDEDALCATTRGFPQLRAYLAATPWPRFTEQCGLSQEEVERFARRLHRSPKTFFRIGVGLTRNSRGGMAVRAIASLAACLGLFAEGAGRGVLLFTGAFKGEKQALTHPELARGPVRRVNMIQLGHALTALQPPIHALICFNANPLSTAPDSSLVRQGLGREDLFTIVHEQVMTPTATYADLLLPATTFLENRDLYTAYGHFYLAVAEPVIEPVAEARSNFEFFQALGQRLGFRDPAFRETVNDRLAGFLRSLAGLPDNHTGIPEAGIYVRSSNDLGNASAYGPDALLFNFAPDAVADHGGIAHLTLSTEFDDPDLAPRYPFLLLTPPHSDLLNSTFGEQHAARSGEVLIHPDDADRCELRSGEEVILENGRGRVRRTAKISDDVKPGLLVAEGLFWPGAATAGGLNDLTSQRTSDMGGGALFHECRVRVARAG